MIPANGIKTGDRYMVNEVVAFNCEQGYTLQVRFTTMQKHFVYFNDAYSEIENFLLLATNYTL